MNLKTRVDNFSWDQDPADDRLRVLSRLDERYFATPEDRLRMYLSVYEGSTEGEYTQITEENVVEILALCRGPEDSPSPNDPDTALTICEEITKSLSEGSKWFMYSIDYAPLFVRKLKGTDLPELPEGYITAERVREVKGVSVRTVVDLIRSGRIDGGAYRGKVWGVDPNERFDYWISTPDDPCVTYRRVLMGVELLESGFTGNLWTEVDRHEEHIPKFGVLSSQSTAVYLNNLTQNYDELVELLDKLWERRELTLYG